MATCRDGIVLAIVLVLSATNAAGAPPPWLMWRTFIGGTQADGDQARGIAVDASDNVYFAGIARSDWSGLCPTVPAGFTGSAPNAFVVKLSSAGEVVWCSFVAKEGKATQANGVALDCDGNVYLTGEGASLNDPQCLLGSDPSSSGFIAKLKPSGEQEWFQCVGSAGKAVAVDCSNGVYVAGQVGGSEGEAFAVKLQVEQQGGEDLPPEPKGECRYIAPSHANAIALDEGGNVYVAGRSSGKPFAGSCLPGGDDPKPFDVFAELPDVDALLGEAWAVSLDDGGMVYVAGRIGTQAFLARHDQNGNLIDEESFGADSHLDVATGIAVDGGPDAYVVGYSGASWGAPEVSHAGGEDAWLARVSSDGVTWNTFLGSTAGEWGTGVAEDSSGRVVIVGYGAGPWEVGTWLDPIVEHVGSDDPFVVKTSLVVPCSAGECDGACLARRAEAWGEYESCIAAGEAEYYANPEPFHHGVFDGCRSTYFDTWEGCAARFEATAETVTDHLTGLVWEKKNHDPETPHDVAATHSWSVPGSVAETGTAFGTFLQALNAGGGFAGSKGWRLPTLAELQTLMSKSGTGMVPEFPDRENNSQGQYWSSTSSPLVYGGCETKLSCAWNVMFEPTPALKPQTGSVGVNGKGTDGKGGKQHVRAVRGGW